MLKDSLKVLLGSTIVYNTKVQAFHWNIEGPNFSEYHELLGDVYDASHATVDKIAEYIRILDNYSPGALVRFLELSKIKEQTKVPRAELMFKELLEDTQTLCDIAGMVFDDATAEKKQAIANYAADLMDIHDKYAWFFRSILKKNRA